MASRKKVVFRDDGTIVESPDDEEQDASSSQVATTPHTAVSAQPGAHVAIRSNRARPRPAMTVARGRGCRRTPGLHCFGAGGQHYTGSQGGRNSRASAPDGRTHLILRSIRNTPPQRTVSEQHIPGVAQSNYQLSTNTTSYSQQSWLNIGSIPSHTGIREDGAFDGLDGNTNSRALVPYDVQPDPIASQQAIVVANPSGPTGGNNANTLGAHQNSYGLRNSASNYARHTTESPTPEVFVREDGTLCGPGIDKKDEDKAMTVYQGTPQDVESTVHQDDPQDADLKRGANVDLKRGANAGPKTGTSAHKVTTLVATDPLLESTDPQHQPGSVTVHHRAPSPKQGLVDDPQDDGQERGEQVDPQPIPASSSDTGTSMQDIDGDDDEAKAQVQIIEIPANWQPTPPSLSHISQELGNDVDTSSMGLIAWRPDSPEFDDEGLLVEENHRDQPSQQASQQGDLEEGSTEDDGKIPALVPIGQGNAENSDEMPRLVRDPNQDPLNQNPHAALADDSDDEVPDTDAPRPNNTNGAEDQEPRACASVASSSSGSDDTGNQPSFSKLTKLPDTGMRQRRPRADTQSNKQDRTPKTKRAPRDQAVNAPSTMASVARDVCTDILSPLVGSK